MEKNLTQKEVAEILGVSEKTLERWRWVRSGPPYVKLVGNVRYRRKDLEQWLEEQTVRPTQSATASQRAAAARK